MGETAIAISEGKRASPYPFDTKTLFSAYILGWRVSSVLFLQPSILNAENQAFSHPEEGFFPGHRVSILKLGQSQTHLGGRLVTLSWLPHPGHHCKADTVVARLKPARPPLPEGWHGALCSRPQTGLFNISSCRAFTESHLTLSLKERGARCQAGHLQQFTINLRRIKHPARSVLFLTR